VRGLTSRVVPSVFQPGKTVAEHIAHILAILLNKERAVSENSYTISFARLSLRMAIANAPHMMSCDWGGLGEVRYDKRLRRSVYYG
jgi:hypothetical protein